MWCTRLLHGWAPALAVPVLLALAGTPPARAQDSVPPAGAQPAGPRFQLVNGTGSVATGLHAVRSGRQDWGRNLVEGRGMRPGQSLTVTAAAEAGCVFDLRLVLIDRPPLEQRRVDVCQTARFEFTAAAPAAPEAPGKPPPGMTGIQPDPGAPQVAGRPPPGAVPPPGGGQPGQPGQRGRVNSGTGFVVAEGRVLTNSHVVEQCSRITARTADGRQLPAQVGARDAALDLALLTVPRDAGPALTFRETPAVRRGDEVVTYGFPLSGLLSSGPTLTRGDVSALAGLRDDQAQLQISAPVQPGNSGGPLLDRAGNVVGVIVSKLNAQRVAERTGDIPQNVNFAIRGERAVAFLRRHGVSPRLAVSATERPAAEVGEIAHPSTLFLQCFR